jgi:hypothetical protein
MDKDITETESYGLLLHALQFAGISDITEFQTTEAYPTNIYQ